jgi:ketosteroid isomerase-like protein
MWGTRSSSRFGTRAVQTSGGSVMWVSASMMSCGAMGETVIPRMPPVSMSSVRAIRELILSYADLVGVGDVEGLAELFAHAELSATGNPRVSRGRDEIRETYIATLGGPGSERPHVHNVVTNLMIDADDDEGTATAKSYFTVVRSRSASSLNISIAGRYEDAFERVDGTWRFTRRHIIIDLLGEADDLLAGVAELAKAEEAGTAS